MGTTAAWNFLHPAGIEAFMALNRGQLNYSTAILDAQGGHAPCTPRKPQPVWRTHPDIAPERGIHAASMPERH
jgi:hypothetical protein